MQNSKDKGKNRWVKTIGHFGVFVLDDNCEECFYLLRACVICLHPIQIFAWIREIDFFIYLDKIESLLNRPMVWLDWKNILAIHLDIFLSASLIRFWKFNAKNILLLSHYMYWSYWLYIKKAPQTNPFI